MKKATFICLMLIGILHVSCLLTPLFASSMVEVALGSRADLKRLLHDGFDVVYVTPGQTADVVVYDESDLLRLGETGLHYRVTQPDLEQYFAARYAPQRDDMGGFRTFDEIVDELQDIHEEYEDIVSRPISIGNTIEDRDIWAVKISDNPEEDEDEPEVLFTSLIHSREVITQDVLFEVMHQLVEAYGEDEYLTDLVDEREIWFIPCHNPDGYVENERTNPDGGGMHRKNMRDNGEEDEQRGVDLNRNYALNWGYDNYGSSPVARDQTYRGNAPFSEPESNAVREFVNDHEFAISIFFHSYGNLCLYSWGHDYIHAEDREILEAIANRFTRENDYLPGTGWETLYVVNGDSEDWLYASDEHDRILSFTIEVGSRDDYFWPPRERVPDLIEENVGVCLQAIEYSLQPERALPPPTPQDVTYHVDGRGRVNLAWETADDEFNTPVSYSVKVISAGEGFIDSVSMDNEFWEELYITATNFQPRGAPNCYRVQTQAPMGYLATAEEIVPPDTLRAWLRYDMTRNNNFALEVSENGYNWVAVPGLYTEDIEVEGFNHGPCIRNRRTNGYEQHWWDLTDWSGRHVKLRFRYYHFRNAGRGDIIYIDDIGPLPGIEWQDIIANDVEDNRWIGEIEGEGDLSFFVRSVDAEGDVSFWSEPALEVEGRRGYALPAGFGWSIVSLPVEPDSAQLEVFFRDWIEQEILILVKDALGRFFLPEFDFNQIGEWNPLEAYWIKMIEQDTLWISGNRIPADTPIGLNAGWNMKAYLPEVPMPAETAFAGIEENLLFVKDDMGNFWVVEYDFSNLGDLTPGKGYLIKMSEPDELIYPVENLADAFPGAARGAPATEFIPSGYQNHSLLLKFDPSGSPGEIILRDSDGAIAGVAAVDAKGERVGIAAWGETAENTDGYATDESFRLFWLESNFSSEVQLRYNIVRGDEGWQENGFSVMDVDIQGSRVLPVEYGITAVHPNPFNATTELVYNLKNQAYVRLGIYDSAGRSVQELHSGSKIAGVHYVTWNAATYPSGLYFAKLMIDSQRKPGGSTIKLVLVR